MQKSQSVITESRYFSTGFESEEEYTRWEEQVLQPCYFYSIKVFVQWRISTMDLHTSSQMQVVGRQLS